MTQTPNTPLVWLRGEVNTPPFGAAARVEAGFLLRRRQQGESFGLPHSRPMPTVGTRCHALRITDRTRSWRIMYHVAADAVVVVEAFDKKTEATPAALATQLGSSQSRVATMEAADTSVSLDLMMRSLLSIGATGHLP